MIVPGPRQIARGVAVVAGMSNSLVLGEVIVVLDQRVVRRGARRCELTPLEGSLLCFLAERRGQWVPRAVLLEAVWGYSPRACTRAVDHTIFRLRKKIEADPGQPRWITSARGGGYRLEGEHADLEPSLLERCIAALRHASQLLAVGNQVGARAVVARAWGELHERVG